MFGDDVGLGTDMTGMGWGWEQVGRGWGGDGDNKLSPCSSPGNAMLICKLDIPFLEHT